VLDYFRSKTTNKFLSFRGLIMKDAGSEAKRDAPAAAQRETGDSPAPELTVARGDLASAINGTLTEAATTNVIERIWNKDASLWKDEESHRKIIANSLGWLRVAGEMERVAGELSSFADTIRAAGFLHAMVCGMGGSSLCPEVLRQTFGRQQNFPELLVLDSTDPDSINNFKKQIDVSRCLFVIASKSGTTTEPIAFHRYWYNEVAQSGKTPGDAFVTITDPGSQMADTAASEGFRRIFLNQADIGGRYSALSYFGLVPAALMGLDVARLLRQTSVMVERCRDDASNNPAALLGSVLSACALAGRDKLTIVTDDALAALGLWVEQLIAESTGKEGQGIVPVVAEPLGEPSSYGTDRLFVSISVGEPGGENLTKLKTLEAAGHPVVYRSLNDLHDLGAEFFLWEFATAVAGWRLRINPFDQPNVQESKDATKSILETYKRAGKLEEQTPLASSDSLSIYSDKADGGTVEEVLSEHYSTIKNGDYVALLAYIEETPATESALQDLRTTIRNATGCATTVGYGPRFLHSTGQLHKGGPDSGVFIQITAPDKVDFAVPEEPYSFSVLKDAQALGDFQSLLKHGRRAIRVDLGGDVLTGLARLQDLIGKIAESE
jgi:glucose-6-phosphate isomerase